ncbi:MAG TPA: SPW repeat protein [Solirubrobacteraceae bacterium]|nr:SPW repeat protein [Solirubrobacteraceae bacterium]
MFAGAWLIVSPYVLSYDGRDAPWNPILAGILILLLALARLTFAVWVSWISWINVALGTWLLGTSAWLAESSAARWNEAVVGGLVIVLALLAGGATPVARRRAAARG